METRETLSINSPNLEFQPKNKMSNSVINIYSAFTNKTQQSYYVVPQKKVWMKSLLNLWMYIGPRRNKKAYKKVIKFMRMAV